MRPPDAQRPPAGTPTGEQNDRAGRPQPTGWLVDGHDIPAHLLASPTVGAWQRANGVTGPCQYARVELAKAITEEATRVAVIDALDPIFAGLHRHACPRDIGRRLRRIADELDPPAFEHEAAA